ncbi:sugar ABC transporter ATP-binding protein [Cohnella massiliensis]|uniref:sugar ABC transporter ATP-binding protein n=1 Tax=Cohnella massiliensis TaxID=1816691 RepID=UPI001BC8C122|nr:sugar ABC transporter ATP-binding protein [Cohnella massiliensis]
MALLKASRLDKRFGQNYALSGVDIEIEPGEVHALVGENGAGKSTLIKIVTGVYVPDGGELLWEGRPVDVGSPVQARRLGINAVHQERHLVPSFTGYENLFLGLDYPKRAFGAAVDWRKMRREADRLRDELGLSLELNLAASRMSPPQKTMLEIMRAMMTGCRLLILDEPTASLTDQESERLFELIGRLTSQGTAILYVSHRMDEIFRLSDRISVFRNGRSVGTFLAEDTSKERVIRLMSDDKTDGASAKRDRLRPGESLLEVSGLSTADGKVREASLTVRRHEIVGLFGLAGAGRTELLEAIYGLRRVSSGEARLKGGPIALSPRHSLGRGAVLIPEERKRDGLVAGMSIRENMTLPVLGVFSGGFRMKGRKERGEVERRMAEMNVKATGTEQAVGELSGGNQQKVVFAKALLSDPDLLLCDEPTQAVDVMTRAEIHRLLKEQARQGRGVLFVSSDLQEVLDVADRLYVMREGRIAAELDEDGLTAGQVLQICYGQG